MKKYLFKSISSFILSILLLLSAIYSTTIFKDDYIANADTLSELKDQQETVLDELANEDYFDNSYIIEPTDISKPDEIEQISVTLESDIINGKIDAELNLSKEIKDYYYVAENVEIDGVSIANNKILADIETDEGLGKINFYIQDDAGVWQNTTLFTFTSAGQCFISNESEDDAWYKAYLYKYERGLITEAEIDSDYAIFSRRDIEEELITDNVMTHLQEDYYVQTDLQDLEILSSSESIAPLATSTSANTYIKGRLTWTTSTGKYLPLKYTRVDLYDRDSIGDDYLKTTFTDNNGNYSFTITNADGFWDFENGGYDVYIKCYPDSYTMQITRDWLLPEFTYYYFKSSVVQNIITGSTTEFNLRLLYNEDNMNNCAFYIEQGMVVAQRFAQAMGMSTTKFLTVQFPFTGDTNAFCYNTISGIGKPYFNDFDTVMHEYGHFVEGVMGNYGSNIIDFILYNPTHYASTDHFDDKDSERYAMELTWSESWATAFAQIAQEYYKSEYDGYVDGFADIYDNINFETFTYTTSSGEAQENAVTAFLWDLYDDSGSSESYDNIALGYKLWWTYTTRRGTYTLTDFVNVIDTYYQSYRGHIGEIMAAHQISPGNLTITNTANVSSTVAPVLSWKVNGSKTNPNNRFQVLFFDNYGNKIYSSPVITSSLAYNSVYSYTVSQSIWNQVLKNYKGTFTINIAVSAYHTGTITSGPYYSKYASKTFSVEQNLSIAASNRYTETVIKLDKGEYCDTNITFTTAGYKLIQTFGTKDTYIYLYNASGTLLTSNDDGGYGLNGLIRYYVSANTQYKIRVKFYSSTVYGTTKLSITPAYGALNSGVTSLSSYEDIYSINSTNYTWASYATINYTRMVTFTPPVAGTYTFELSSTFDNYIYVIDPRSSEILINNVDYNDDGGTGLNARLSRYLDANVPYLVIYCKYNPSNAFSDTDSTTLKLTITKSGLPTVPSTPIYLQLTLKDRSGSIIYNWDVEITNPNSFPVQVTYNSKMCFESDAKNYTNLVDLVTITIPANSSVTVRINGNGTAGWITTCIDYTSDSSSYRRVTCANGLSGNLTMNTPVNNQIAYT